MRIHYHQAADALYLRLDESEVVDSQEVNPGLVLDFNADDEVVGIEVLRLRSRFPSADPEHLHVHIA
jgi:uncharacterized protein YuzE